MWVSARLDPACAPLLPLPRPRVPLLPLEPRSVVPATVVAPEVAVVTVEVEVADAGGAALVFSERPLFELAFPRVGPLPRPEPRAGGGGPSSPPAPPLPLPPRPLPRSPGRLPPLPLPRRGTSPLPSPVCTTSETGGVGSVGAVVVATVLVASPAVTPLAVVPELAGATSVPTSGPTGAAPVGGTASGGSPAEPMPPAPMTPAVAIPCKGLLGWGALTVPVTVATLLLSAASAIST